MFEHVLAIPLEKPHDHILIADDAQQIFYGKVVDVGFGGEPHGFPMQVRVNDRIYAKTIDTTQLTINDQQYVVLSQRDILCKES